ncbi:MAG TPA: DUF4124 domain-containing protein [Xanthomonadales bacterium]|nr:DUF4124 domain-containing protein [Xanthomonadales bacterium]
MNTSTYLGFTAASILAVSVAVHAQNTTVYTWTDENGVVHYVDTPRDNPAAIAIDAPEAYRPGTEGVYAEAEPAAAPEGEEAEPVQSYADEQRAQMAVKREKAQATQKEREMLCAEARKQRARLEPSRRVYFTNDQGETERLDDQERVRMVEEAKQQIDQNCD